MHIMITIMMRMMMMIIIIIKSWTIICWSRRDQEEGGGAGTGLSRRAGQSFAGPGEIKRREVELGSESWTTLSFSCFSTVALRTLSS